MSISSPRIGRYPTVLWKQSFLAMFMSGHHLDARDQRRLESFQLGRHWRLMQDTIDPVADAQFVLRRFK